VFGRDWIIRISAHKCSSVVKKLTPHLSMN
jgi:hypothetical protein